MASLRDLNHVAGKILFDQKFARDFERNRIAAVAGLGIKLTNVQKKQLKDADLQSLISLSLAANTPAN